MTEEVTAYDARKTALQAREKILEASSLITVCAQALDSLAVNDMSKIIYDTTQGCENLLNDLQDKLLNTEKLLGAI